MRIAQASKAGIEKRLGQKVVTAIVGWAEFYRAEEYHQDYHKTHAIQYRFYRWKCGRDARLEKIWGKG